MTMDDDARRDKKALGIAGLFDDVERKELFRKYLIFLGWMEVAIFVACWIYQLGTDGYDRFGPVEIPFPWKTYFLVAFLAPVAVTFLIGTIIVGFNRYMTPGTVKNAAEDSGMGLEDEENPTRIDRATMALQWFQKVPYLGLLLLLALGIGVVYKMDVVLAIAGKIGGQSVRILLVGAAVVLGVASVLLLVLLVLNYKLRKRSMEYRYRSEVAERYGLVILDDNTVLSQDGKLLVRGKKWKDAVPLLTAETTESSMGARDSLPQPSDVSS